MKKNILVIIRTAPYGQSKSKDAIDFILTAAAYDQELHVLFQGDGVFHLLPNQDPSGIPSKNINKLLSAFEMYEIENIHADNGSLAQRSMNSATIVPKVQISSSEFKQDLISSADTVLTF